MIAFCTTVKGRLAHLAQTLPRNLADNAGCAAPHQFVILNYGDWEIGPYLAEHHARDLDSGRVVLYTYWGWPKFRMAHAKNLAHRCGLREGANLLVNLDADNFTGPGFADYVATKFREPNAFLWSRMIKDGPQRMQRGISGRIAVTKEQFLNVGGYDERFADWGPDDKDFQTRLRNLGYDAREIDREFLSGVDHNDKMRFREYPHAADAADAEHFQAVESSTATVANFGRFGCGAVTRNFDPTPIELKPLPTRIFGVGLHKTGTTSLHHALGVLGFQSAHWPSAHWAKTVWREIAANGRSPRLERTYAASDLPIALLYRELDRAYPGSKFILTTRNEEAWLNSVRNHWSHDKNPFRHQWNHDPFTHRVHQLVYGRRDFDAPTMLARFRRHNAEVQEHFGDRLLTLDLDAGPAWGPLCEFLDCPIPTEPYPRKFSTPR